MNIVKTVKGIQIERRESDGHEYFVLWFPEGGYNKAYSMKEAVSLAKWYAKRRGKNHGKQV